MADSPGTLERQIVDELHRWQERFLAGKVRFTQLFRRPPLHEGERFAVQIPHVGYAPPGGGMEAHSKLTGSSEGSAWATSDRLFVADASKVKHEWSWSGVSQVQVLPQWNGVTFDIGADLPAMLRNEATLTSGPAKPAAMAAAWLKVEAAYAASQGQMEQWMDRLPSRLDGVG